MEDSRTNHLNNLEIPLIIHKNNKFIVFVRGNAYKIENLMLLLLILSCIPPDITKQNKYKLYDLLYYLGLSYNNTLLTFDFLYDQTLDFKIKLW